ncbi:hypothetical protein FOCC_FOCC004226 [Frankliniella occidentalis]|nr:hypothetical protein FOCC_FOCC004226 [Frankliniella occidentalis]
MCAKETERPRTENGSELLDKGETEEMAALLLERLLEKLLEVPRRSPQRCVACGVLKPSAGTLVKHLVRKHFRGEPFPCVVDGCSQTIVSDLYAHERTVHGRHRTHHCELCERAFTLRPLLVRHVRRAHAQSPEDAEAAEDTENVGRRPQPSARSAYGRYLDGLSSEALRSLYEQQFGLGNNNCHGEQHQAGRHLGDTNGPKCDLCPPPATSEPMPSPAGPPTPPPSPPPLPATAPALGPPPGAKETLGEVSLQNNQTVNSSTSASKENGKRRPGRPRKQRPESASGAASEEACKPSRGRPKKQHPEQSAGRKQRISRCVPCGIRFALAQDLYAHERAVHGLHRPHHCEHCERAFPTSSGLRRHERRRHEPHEHGAAASAASYGGGRGESFHEDTGTELMMRKLLGLKAREI